MARSVTTVGVEAVFKFPSDEVALASGVDVNDIDRSPVVARFIHPLNRLAPCAHAGAVHDSDLAEVVFAFDERSVVRLVGRELAEGPHSVVVEDRHTVDAGTHHLIIFEVTVVALGASGQGNVINPDFVHVIVLMVESNPHVLAGIGTQVNRV